MIVKYNFALSEKCWDRLCMDPYSTRGLERSHYQNQTLARSGAEVSIVANISSERGDEFEANIHSFSSVDQMVTTMLDDLIYEHEYVSGWPTSSDNQAPRWGRLGDKDHLLMLHYILSVNRTPDDLLGLIERSTGLKLSAKEYVWRILDLPYQKWELWAKGRPDPEDPIFDIIDLTIENISHFRGEHPDPRVIAFPVFFDTLRGLTETYLRYAYGLESEGWHLAFDSQWSAGGAIILAKDRDGNVLINPSPMPYGAPSTPDDPGVVVIQSTEPEHQALVEMAQVAYKAKLKSRGRAR